jgi:hypothetical protein
MKRVSGSRKTANLSESFSPGKQNFRRRVYASSSFPVDAAGRHEREQLWTKRDKGNTTKDSYPRIVAKIDLTGQTATIPTTTIVAPKKNGLYRISAYSAITVPGGHGWW